MTFSDRGLNIQTLKEFLLCFEPEDWIPIRAVMEVFGATEDAVVRLCTLFWMRDVTRHPEKIGNEYIFQIVRSDKLTTKDVKPTTPEPVPENETVGEKIARIKARQAAYVTPTEIRKCEECLNNFETEVSRLPHVVCQDCRDGWRRKYVSQPDYC